MKKVLIVDNSLVILNVLKDLFQENKYFEVYTAKSLDEVKELLSSHKFFLATSNIVLPDALNGELIELLDDNDIPTIVLSSRIDSDFIRKMETADNVIDYVLKENINGLQRVVEVSELLLYMKGAEILIVDDSITLLESMKSTLKNLMLNIHTAKCGKEALEVLEKNRNIELLIADYNMPNMNGLDLVKRIQKLDDFHELPIMVVSSEEDKRLKVNLFKNGANDFLSKPILKEELKSKVINIFENHKRLKDIRNFNSVFDDNIISSFTDIKGVIKSASNAFCKISGYKKEELIGQPHNIVRHPDMPKSLYEDLWSTIQSGKVWKGEVKNKKKDGSDYWVEVVVEPQFDRDKEITGFFAIRQDITDKKRIYELSITDGLTNLYNRRYFNEKAKDIMAKTLELNNTFGFLILDIDNFKKYNDTYGHQDGDSVLINVANCLKKSFQNSEAEVFRLGGEEFGVTINANSIEEIEKLAEDSRADIQALAIEHEKNPPKVVTASFGLILIDENKDICIENIYKASDDLLYEAKEGGRNRVVSKKL